MILITGASGNVGKAVIACLRTRQVPLRIGSRKANSIASQDGIEVVPFDFLDAGTFRSARMTATLFSCCVLQLSLIPVEPLIRFLM